jgi:general secretion pathway protein G
VKIALSNSVFLKFGLVRIILNQFLCEGKKMKSKRGFTLVEILIVVVILGILAAIVIPQFTNASTEAKLSSLKSDLQTVRSQIELYKIQHDDSAPTAANFTAQMTVQDANGFGPYLQKVPTNPFSGGNSVTADGSGGDWKLETASGVTTFTAADGGSTDGVAHSSW